MKNGIGKYVKPNGEIYIGEFRDDSYNGKGILTLPDGIVQKGLFKNGVFKFEFDFDQAFLI
jgi:hypothetical protein